MAQGVPHVDRDTIVAQALAGVPVYRLAQMYRLSLSAIYRYIRDDAPDAVIQRIDDTQDTLAQRIVASAQAKIDVSDAISHIIYCLANGLDCDCDPDFKAYLLSQPIDKIGDVLSGMEGSALRSAFTLTKIQALSQANAAAAIDASIGVSQLTAPDTAPPDTLDGVYTEQLPIPVDNGSGVSATLPSTE